MDKNEEEYNDDILFHNGIELDCAFKLDTYTNPSYDETIDDVFEITCLCTITTNGVPLFDPIPFPFRHFPDPMLCRWDEWMKLPINIKTLNKDSQLVIVLLKDMETVLGVTHINVFHGGYLRAGRYLSMVITPGEDLYSGEDCVTQHDVNNPELTRLISLLNMMTTGTLPSDDYLDRHVLLEIGRLNKKQPVQTDTSYISLSFPEFSKPVRFAPDSIVIGECHVSQQLDLPFNVTLPQQHICSRLVRSKKHLDNIKPDEATRRKLKTALSVLQFSNLTTEQTDLIWVYQYALSRDPHALPHFMYSVDWTDEAQTEQGLATMHKWNLPTHPISVDDDVLTSFGLLGVCVCLLSEDFIRTKGSGHIRSFAVDKLRLCPPAHISFVLLPLVQSLKLDSLVGHTSLRDFIIDVCVGSSDNLRMLTYLYWGLQSEIEHVINRDVEREFLEDTLSLLLSVLSPDIRALLDRHHEFDATIKHLKSITTNMKRSVGIEWLRENSAKHISPLLDDPLPWHVDPSIKIDAYVAEKAGIFGSAQRPYTLTFMQTKDAKGERERYRVIYKVGDDVRQDQFVIAMFELFDYILKRHGMNLLFTCYPSLATGTDSGCVYRVPGVQGLSDILKENKNGLTGYFQTLHPSTSREYGYVDSTVIENYIKSLAGYSVATYLLGIGDRHNDNVMVFEDGRVMHIDFGFILGKDPKPFPAPMKLTREMIDAMGGKKSFPFRKFRELCCEAFLVLRKHAQLIWAIVSNMKSAGYQSFGDSDAEIHKALATVIEKFRLDISDLEAYDYIQNLIEESINAIFMRVSEVIHSAATALR
ncbi:hypothetical protein PCE1_003511 [Barthelona sp. PCE]